MASLHECNICRARVEKVEIPKHVEEMHVGPRMIDGQVLIGCGKCSYQVPIVNMNAMLDHFTLVGHDSHRLRYDWNSFLKSEEFRLTKIARLSFEIIRSSSSAKKLCDSDLSMPSVLLPDQQRAGRNGDEKESLKTMETKGGEDDEANAQRRAIGENEKPDLMSDSIRIPRPISPPPSFGVSIPLKSSESTVMSPDNQVLNLSDALPGKTPRFLELSSETRDQESPAIFEGANPDYGSSTLDHEAFDGLRPSLDQYRTLHPRVRGEDSDANEGDNTEEILVTKHRKNGKTRKRQAETIQVSESPPKQERKMSSSTSEGAEDTSNEHTPKIFHPDAIPESAKDISQNESLHQSLIQRKPVPVSKRFDVCKKREAKGGKPCTSLECSICAHKIHFCFGAPVRAAIWHTFSHANEELKPLKCSSCNYRTAVHHKIREHKSMQRRGKRCDVGYENVQTKESIEKARQLLLITFPRANWDHLIPPGTTRHGIKF